MPQDGQPLADFMPRFYARLSPGEKRRMAVKLGQAVRRWHDAGTQVCKADDIVVTHRMPANTDFLPRGRHLPGSHRPLSKRRRIKALGGLLSDCWDFTSRSERQRFLRAYVRSGPEIGQLHRGLIEKCAYEKSYAAWHRQGRYCFGNNAAFCAGHRDGFRYHGDKQRAGTALRELLPDPDKILEQGQIFKPGSRTHAGRIYLSCGEGFLKRFNDRGWWYRVRHLFRRSRAVHNWKVMWAFRYRRIPVADPVLCLEERFFRILKRSYVLTDFAEGGQRLKVVWQGLSDAQRCCLLIVLAQLLGRMHRFGCLHGDLKWDNILVCATGKGWRITLVDLDGSRVLRRPAANRAIRDVGRFLRDLEQVDTTGQWGRMFRRSWKKWITNI